MAADRSSSLARGIGIGCLVAAVLAVVGIGACSVWLYQRGRQLEREMEDPELRRQRVLEILGAEDLPAGYHPAVAFSVPFVLDTAILSGEPVSAGEPEPDLGERGFIYVDTVGLGMDETALRDFFEGRTDDPAVLEDSGVELEIEEILDRGVIRREDADLWYLSQRGDLSMDDYGGAGIAAVIFVDCADDERRRFGIWFVPDPAADVAGGVPADELDLTGTPADPEAIEELMAHFSFCR